MPLHITLVEPGVGDVLPFNIDGVTHDRDTDSNRGSAWIPEDDSSYDTSYKCFAPIISGRIGVSPPIGVIHGILRVKVFSYDFRHRRLEGQQPPTERRALELITQGFPPPSRLQILDTIVDWEIDQPKLFLEKSGATLVGLIQQGKLARCLLVSRFLSGSQNLKQTPWLRRAEPF